MQKEIFERIKAAFEANTDAQHLFVTSDGQCFFNNNPASNHSKDLAKAGGDPAVIKVFREQMDVLLKSIEDIKNAVDRVFNKTEPVIDGEKEPIAPAENPLNDNAPVINGEKEPIVPAEKPLGDMLKKELQAKATSLGIEFKEDDTKGVLIDLITNFNTK